MAPKNTDLAVMPVAETKLMQLKAGSKALDAPVTREDVIYAYRMIFGCDPESEMAVLYHSQVHADVATLRDSLIAASQFRFAASGPRMEQSRWVMTEIFSGYRLWLDLHDIGVSKGCLLGTWEETETRFMRANVKLGDTVIDIGANIGWFSLLAASKCGETGHVHAFEPHPLFARYLQRSITESRIDNRVSLHQIALSEAAGRAILGAPENTENPGHNWLLSDNQASKPGFEKHRVSTMRLDDVLPDVKPTFIKLDVEGAEARVIRGAEAIIRASKPVIMSELFPDQLQTVSGVSGSAFIAEMAKLGYVCWTLGHDGPKDRITHFEGENGQNYISVIFEPKKS